MRILVATDGSEASLHAAAEAAALFPGADEVRLAHVVPPIDEPAETAGGFEGPISTPEETRALRDSLRVEALAHLATTARSFGPRPVFEDVLEHVDPGAAIVDRAGEVDADVVVIGSQGHGVLHRMLLGSVSTHVVRHAPCPVLVVPSTDRHAGRHRRHAASRS
jgi:nucleotide-binding universal stress UspA family protein